MGVFPVKGIAGEFKVAALPGKPDCVDVKFYGAAIPSGDSTKRLKLCQTAGSVEWEAWKSALVRARPPSPPPRSLFQGVRRLPPPPPLAVSDFLRI